MKIGIIIKHIPNNKLFHGGVENMWLELSKHLPYEILFLTPADKALARTCDILITNGFAGWQYTLFNKPRIHIYHGTAAGSLLSGSAIKYGRAWPFEMFGGIHTTRVAVSKCTQQELNKYYFMQSHLIYNGVDINRFAPCKNKAALKRKLRLPVNKLVALYSGAETFRKGFDIYNKLSEEFKDSIKFITTRSLNLPFDKLHLLYQAVDIYLYPSRYDGDALSLLEAMACGLPFVGFPSGRLKTELVGNFQRCQTANYAEFKNKFSGLIKNPKLMASLGKDNRTYIENYSWEKVAKKYNCLIRQILKLN